MSDRGEYQTPDGIPVNAWCPCGAVLSIWGEKGSQQVVQHGPNPEARREFIDLEAEWGGSVSECIERHAEFAAWLDAVHAREGLTKLYMDGRLIYANAIKIDLGRP